MTAIKISRPGDTWNGVAYTYYNDSREFRTILGLNPGYDIRSFPAPGLPMQIQELGGITTTGSASIGSLIQQDTNIDLRAGSPANVTPESIFPWSTVEAYEARRADYVPATLAEVNRLNGFTLDTSQAQTGNQSG
jgi:hypothetical protein